MRQTQKWILPYSLIHRDSLLRSEAFMFSMVTLTKLLPIELPLHRYQRNLQIYWIEYFNFKK